VRRLLLLALTSVLLLSACSTAAATQAQPPAFDAPNGGHGLATPAPTPVPSVQATIAPRDGDWISFAPDGGGFIAKFPATPKLTTSTAKTTFGDAATSLWTDEHGGNLSYYVQATVYPAGPLIAAQSASVYDAAINSLTGGSSGLAVAAENDVTLNGHAGKLFLLRSSLGSVKGEVVLAGSTVYIAFVAYASSVDSGLIDTFLADFELNV
jgi:hypothetical protein